MQYPKESDKNITAGTRNRKGQKREKRKRNAQMRGNAEWKWLEWKRRNGICRRKKKARKHAWNAVSDAQQNNKVRHAEIKPPVLGEMGEW